LHVFDGIIDIFCGVTDVQP